MNNVEVKAEERDGSQGAGSQVAGGQGAGGHDDLRDSVPMVRVTGILVENDQVLLVKQVLRERSHWSLPGGRLEFGETLEECLVREMREETGLEVRPVELLYVCDRFRALRHHVVDMSFLVQRTGGRLMEASLSDAGSERLEHVCMVPVDELCAYGFSESFRSLVREGFPQKGSYQGDFHRFYG